MYYVIEPTELRIICGPVSSLPLAEEAITRPHLQYALRGSTLKIILVPDEETYYVYFEDKNTEGIHPRVD